MDFLEGILYVLWRGFAIGVIISAPMGPVGILCVQRTLDKGRKAGFYTGIGAAISDLFYCLLTGFGLSFIEEFLEKNQNVIQIIGSIVLIIFGLYLFRANPSRTIKKPGEIKISAGKNVLNGFLFTVSNPLIIFLIIGLFARFNFLLPEIKFYHYIVGFVCIILGALTWWWLVTFFVDKVRAHFNLRSMWLINKLTGSIIMIFGVVGIITSAIAMSKANAAPPVYLNSTRGFGKMSAPGSPLHLKADADTLFSIPLPATGDFTLEFRARTLNNVQGKPAQGWGLGAGPSSRYILATSDNILDPMEPSRICASLYNGKKLLSKREIKEGFDMFTGWNAYRLTRRNGIMSLEGGNREYNLIGNSETAVSGDSIRFIVLPGTDLEVDWIHLDTRGSCEISVAGNPDSLESILMRSTDPVEGIWETYDRSLDDDLMRMGGSYRLAAIGNGNGYDLVYLSGAKKNPDAWKPGMIKARLSRGSFKNLFAVDWKDAEGRTLDAECMAEFTEPALLSLQFPAYASSLRLRKVNALR